MIASHMTASAEAAGRWWLDAMDYSVDRIQRGVLFWDTLRQRGNAYFSHLEAGQPPVLVFDYEMVMDGRTFERPVNYSLVRILDRRKSAAPYAVGPDRRIRHTNTGYIPGPRRPIVVIDPRAGHGPGIGGSKFNSQIGAAMEHGHPVYFVMFYTEPEPGQTITDVHRTEIRFLEEVARRHPEAPKPAVIGNCQAGWAAALVAADRPDVVGPIMLNGSPLSYWGGTEGANPMRYRGGLLGGAWLTSLCCDLGNGRFDGAHLVAGFEDLNPANTYWRKHYHLFANVDTEAQRFLAFEKWWGGFFLMNAEEIHFIVDGLFIGNELEQGRLRLDDDHTIDLKRIADPIMIFASGGDNITPPPQALNWIVKVYSSVAEIKRLGQVIVYMVHESVGHLGIFVSGQVARKEHQQIIGGVDLLEYLAPGLYEMVIEAESASGEDAYQVRFEPREMDDILALDDGLEDEAAFVPANHISHLNDWIYRTVGRPAVRASVNEPMAEALRQLHPLRLQRTLISDLNPFCWWLPKAAAVTTRNRRPAPDDNVFFALETVCADAVAAGWDTYRDLRDLGQAFVFKSLFATPWIRTLLGAAPAEDTCRGDHPCDAQTAASPSPACRGGFAEAVVRIIIAVAGANHMLDRRQFETAAAVIAAHPTLRRITPSHYRKLVREQSAILEKEGDIALTSLARLLPTHEERVDAFDIAVRIAEGDAAVDADEKTMLHRIRNVLALTGENDRS